MRSCITWLFTCMAWLPVFGQSSRMTDSILANKTIRIPYYPLALDGNEYLVLKMAFARADWTDTSGLSKLHDATILSVDLLFTDYPTHLDLKPLNHQRFEALFALLPALRHQPHVQYTVVRQMDGKEKASADTMVHGFVINYRPAISVKKSEEEIELITRSLPPRISSPPPKDSIPQPNRRRSNWDYKYSRPFKPRDPDSFKTPHPVLDKPPKIRDSVVINTFQRNRFRRMLVVADVTMSMAGYTSQMLQWLNKQKDSGSLAWLVCFNDGNNTSDSQKKPGATGGIYGMAAEDIYAVGDLVQNTMKSGAGGDTPENNVEALIKGIAMASGYEDVVMLSDAWAGVRDIELIDQVTKPVKVVVCGGPYGPHPDHVTIAVRTGGSLHFKNADVTDFSPLHQGKNMIIGGREYRFDGHRVKLAVR